MINKLTGFSSAQQRSNALDLGYDKQSEYLAYFSEIKEKRRVEQVAIAKKTAALKKTQDRKRKNQEAILALARVEEEQALALVKKQKEENCLKDLACTGDKMTITAGVKCPEYIEKLAKYSYKWNDGMFSLKFTRYKWKDSSKIVITMVGDKIQFQNGFGAMQNHIYFCDIDIASNQVLGVRASPGRL